MIKFSVLLLLIGGLLLFFLIELILKIGLGPDMIGLIEDETWAGLCWAKIVIKILFMINGT